MPEPGRLSTGFGMNVAKTPISRATSFTVSRNVVIASAIDSASVCFRSISCWDAPTSWCEALTGIPICSRYWIVGAAEVAAVVERGLIEVRASVERRRRLAPELASRRGRTRFPDRPGTCSRGPRPREAGGATLPESHQETVSRLEAGCRRTCARPRRRVATEGARRSSGRDGRSRRARRAAYRFRASSRRARRLP